MEDALSSLFARTNRPRRLSDSSVRRSKLDDGIYENMREQSPVFNAAIERAPELDSSGEGSNEYMPHWDDLMGDVFKSLHTYEDPGVLPEDEVKPSRELNRRVMQNFIGSDDFQKSRPITRHAEIEAAFTTMGAAGELRELVSGEMKDLAEEAKNAEKQERTIDRQEEKAEEIREQIRENGGEATDSQKDQLQDAAMRKQNARKRLQDSVQAMQDIPLTRGAAEKLAKAVEQGRKDAQLIASLPGIGKGEKEQLQPDEALRLAQMFKDNPQLMRIAEMLGRIVRDMRFKRARRITGGTEEVVDVTMGNNLERSLTAEKMRLMHPLMKRDFMRRFTESNVMEEEMQGTTEAGYGPLIVLVDESYSMEGQRTTWAKAVCLALVAIARKEKRDAAVISYASNSQQEMWQFPHRDKFDADKVVGMAGHKFNGGTDATPAVQMGFDLTTDDMIYTKADLVIITDGEDNFGDDDQRLRDELKARGVRLHGVMVGDSPSKYLQEMCETLVSAYDLAGANDATDALAANIS